MPKLSDLIKSLGTKGKVDLTKPEVVAALTASEGIEVPKEFADQLEAALMTVDAAVSNQTVRSRVQAEVLNGEDTYLNGIVGQLEVDEEDRTQLTSEKDTRVRIRKAIEALNKAKKKAKKDGDTATEESLKTQVADLNKQLKDIKDIHAAELTKVQGERDNDFINFELMSLLGAKQYALPDTMPVKQRLKTALLVVQDELAQKGFKVVKSENGIKILKKDNTDAYDDKNTLVELPSFIDGTLATNGLLKNSDSQPPADKLSNAPLPIGGTAPVVDTRYLSELDQQIGEMLKPAS